MMLQMHIKSKYRIPLSGYRTACCQRC